MNDGGTLSREILRRGGEAPVIISPKKGKEVTKTEKLRREIEDVLLKQIGARRTHLEGWYVHPDGYTREERPALLTDQILEVCAKAGLEFVIEDAKMPKLSQQRCLSIDAAYSKGIDKIATAYYEAQQCMVGWWKTEEVTIQ